MLRARTFGLFLLLATLLIFLPSSLNQFINFDDPEYVVQNPMVNQGLSLLGIKWAFASAHAANWHPLTWLSHMLDCDLFHLNPAGHHLVNSLFHAANVALLFALILRLTNPLPAANELVREPDNVWPAALVAALFAWHPLHVESVAWVSERKDVLSTFFSLLSLLCYAQYARKEARASAAINQGGWRVVDRDYALAFFCFVLALMSKAMPVTLPFVMLLLDFWPLNRWAAGQNWIAPARNLLLEKLPFFVCSGIVCAITIFTQHHAESSFANIPLGTRVENVVIAYVDYLGKMVWPFHLAIVYPYKPVTSQGIVVESVLILAAISWLVWRERRASPYLFVGWLWFLITLVPVIGLIQVGSQAMADRYTYFPLIGIFLAAGFSLRALAGHFPMLTRWLVAASAAGLVACVFLTERQLSYWHDSETLFRHSIEVEDSEMARLDYGAALQDNNEIDQATTQFLIAWRMHPDSDSGAADLSLAGIMANQGKLELSAAFYEQAAAQHPWNHLLYENYGRVLVSLKRYPEAERAFSKAIQIDPAVAAPHCLMAPILLKEGRDQEALDELQKAMELEPQNLETVIFAATVMASCEDSKIRNGTKAKALARGAVETTHGQQAAALDVLAMSSAELGRFPEAMLFEQQAIKVASTSNQQDGLDLLQKHLDSYQKGQPWRQSFKAN
jgi:tetratricopeptide (TPR) repeat protein